MAGGLPESVHSKARLRGRAGGAADPASVGGSPVTMMGRGASTLRGASCPPPAMKLPASSSPFGAALASSVLPCSIEVSKLAPPASCPLGSSNSPNS